MLREQGSKQEAQEGNSGFCQESFLEEVDVHRDLKTETKSGHSQEKDRRKSVPAEGDQRIPPHLQ